MFEGIFVIAGILAVMGISSERKARRASFVEGERFEKPNIYGGSGVADDKTCERGGLLGSKGVRVGYSLESGREFRCTQDVHWTIVGTTGSSKTSSFVNTNILSQDDCSMVILDAKGGEIMHTTAAHRATLGPVSVISRFGMEIQIPGVKLAHYNPMNRFDDPLTPRIHHGSIAQKISDAGVWNDGSGRDSHWVEGARGVYADFILGTARYGRSDEKNLPFVVKTITTNFVGFCKKMILMKDRELSPRFQAHLQEFQSASRSFPDILQTLRVQTRFLLDEAASTTFKGNGVRFSSLGERVSTVYVVEPVDYLEVSGKVFRQVLGGALSDLLRPERSRKKKIILFCDEAYQYGTMDALVNAYGTARAFKMMLVTVWNDLSQMAERYPKTHMSILGNSGIQTFVGGARDPVTAGFMSQQSGVKEVVSHSRSSSHGRDGYTQVSDSKSQAQRAVLMMNEAMSLPSDQAVMWVRGIPGLIMARHKPYFQGRKYFFRYQQNPLYRKD